MAVAGKDEGDVKALAIELGLLQAVGWGQIFGFGLDESHCDRLSVGVDFDA
jgi:hypothetical protein